MSNHEQSRALSRPTRSPHAVGVLGEGAAASPATDCLAIFPSCVPSRFVMANECLRWWRAVLGAAAQRQQRAFARALRNRWDKAAADKAAADKAANAKRAADKAAADTAAAAALAGAHSTESANAPPAKVAPATQPALSILLNHWGAAVRRCLSTCVDRYHPASPDDDHAA